MWEEFFDCPFCGAGISALLDPSVARQRYIEDCEVCCRPMILELSFEDGLLTGFQVTAVEQ
ncbi:MAG: CPXCG motif-containing cysteine-rich protein [Flavobacteriaceae bacterium]